MTHGDAVTIAARRVGVEDLNVRAREAVRAGGELGPVELEVARRQFAVGDSVVLKRNVVHGYAVTCHVAQGATVDRSLVLADAGLCREWGYTALTRGRYENRLYLSVIARSTATSTDRAACSRPAIR